MIYELFLFIMDGVFFPLTNENKFCEDFAVPTTHNANSRPAP